MIQQLWMDGVLMDVDSNTKIALSIKSNLFRDVTNMASNNSYTVQLPKTLHNMSVIEHADKPRAASQYPYAYHTCEYYRNGASIIKNGSAVVLSVSDKIEVAIYWGLSSAFALLNSEDYSLRDINSADKIKYKIANDLSTYDEAMDNGIFYAGYDSFTRSAEEDGAFSELNMATTVSHQLSLKTGSCTTGTTVGATSQITIDESDDSFRYVTMAVTGGYKLKLEGVCGAGDGRRAYAVLNSENKLLSIASPATDNHVSKETFGSTTSALSIDTYYYNKHMFKGVVTAIVVDCASDGSITYGRIDKDGNVTASKTVTVAKGVNRLTCFIRMDKYDFICLRERTAGVLKAVSSSTPPYEFWSVSADGTKKSQISGKYLAYYITYSYTPIDVTVEMPATAAKAIVNVSEANSYLPNVMLLTPRNVDITDIDTSSTKNTTYLHPLVTVKWLLSQIAATWGVHFIWSDSADMSFVENLAVPLIAHEGDEQSLGSSAVIGINMMRNVGELSLIVAQSAEMFEETGVTKKLTVKVAGTINADIRYTWQWNSTGIKPSSTRQSTFTDRNGNTISYEVQEWLGTDCYIEITIKHADPSLDDDVKTIGVSENNRIFRSTDADGNGTFTYRVVASCQLNLTERDVITMKLKSSRGVMPQFRLSTATIVFSPTNNGDVPFGGYFPVAKNLPDVKVTDFIKFLCCITGCFPRQYDASSNVVLLPYKSISDNISKALDWSFKLIPTVGDKPQSVEFSVSSWCQNNWYKWKEDDTVLQNYDGVLQVNNKTLDFERNVVTYPFAASDGASVPMYTRPKTELRSANNGVVAVSTTPSYKACQDRILNMAKATDGKVSLSFDMNMTRILKNKYSVLRELLDDARVLKVRLRLRDSEIMSFDESVPIYLAQYGAFFAVLELTTTENGYCEAQIIKIR